jgi:hypothetical protein
MILATTLYDKVRESDIRFSDTILRIQSILEPFAKSRRIPEYRHYYAVWQLWTAKGGQYGSLGLIEDQIELSRHGVSYAERRVCCCSTIPETWSQLDDEHRGLGVVKVILKAHKGGFALGVYPEVLLPLAAVIDWLSARPDASEQDFFAAMAALPRAPEGKPVQVWECPLPRFVNVA